VLDDATAKRGVATHSSGNHGTALARAAKLRKIPAHIVMPKTRPKSKCARSKVTVATLFLRADAKRTRSGMRGRNRENSATLIHSFENEDVMAGRDGRDRIA